MPEATTESTRVRAGILGTGAVAHLHAQALALMPRVELVAVSDSSADRAADFAARWAAGGAVPSVHDSLESMLATAELDVVHLCTPPGGHAAQTNAVVGAGCDAIVEKPPAFSLAELDSMTAAAAAAGRRLAVVFQQRTGSAVQHVKRLLDAGAFGAPRFAICHTLWHRDGDYYEVPWRGTWAGEGGGTLLSHGIHQLDLLAHLLGEWREASATLWRLDRDLETEDLATGTVLFEHAGTPVVASVVSTVLAPREQSIIRLDCERATIELVHLYGHGHDHWRITPAQSIDPAEAAQWALPETEVASGHDVLLAEVYAAITAGRPVPPVAAEPARALEIVTALYASAGRGAVVTRHELADPALRGPLGTAVRDLRSTRGRR